LSERRTGDAAGSSSTHADQLEKLATPTIYHTISVHMELSSAIAKRRRAQFGIFSIAHRACAAEHCPARGTASTSQEHYKASAIGDAPNACRRSRRNRLSSQRPLLAGKRHARTADRAIRFSLCQVSDDPGRFAAASKRADVAQGAQKKCSGRTR
jgi:hypothetical protein